MFWSVSGSNFDFSDSPEEPEFWDQLYRILNDPITDDSDEFVWGGSGSTTSEERVTLVILDADLSDEALLMSILRRGGMKSTLDVYEAGLLPGRYRGDHRFVDAMMIEISYMLHSLLRCTCFLSGISCGELRVLKRLQISLTLATMRYFFAGSLTSFLTACKAWIDYCRTRMYSKA
jgi:hypothetical protein